MSEYQKTTETLPAALQDDLRTRGAYAVLIDVAHWLTASAAQFDKTKPEYAGQLRGAATLIARVANSLLI